MKLFILYLILGVFSSTLALFGFLKNKRFISTIGVVTTILLAFWVYIHLFGIRVSLLLFVPVVIYWILLFSAAIIRNKNAIGLSLSATALKVIETIICVICGFYDTPLSYIYAFACIALSVFMAVFFSNKCTSKTVNAASSDRDLKRAMEQLINLKKLLDDDIITQEEFDEKKNQLLGH